jgi:hypothetical protein
VVAVQAVLCDDLEDKEASARWRKRGAVPGLASKPPSMSLTELEEMCDDPARDLPGGSDVRAILTLEPDEGFFLSARDGEAVYVITDNKGKRMKFRTIEIALGILQNVSGLSPDISLLQTNSRRRHH